LPVDCFNAFWAAALYAILDRPTTTSKRDIKIAYKKAALRHHPDKNPDDSEGASARFKCVYEPYAVLSNSGKCGIYNARRTSSGHKDGQGAAAGSMKRTSDEHTDGGEHHGKRPQKVRAADSTSTTSDPRTTTSGKASSLMPDPSAPNKHRTADKLCEHQQRRHRSKFCGGGSICEHQRQRSQCKDCGSSSICEHQRQRSQCKDCGSSSICEHQQLRSVCKDCGGGGICKHQRVRSKCKDCAVRKPIRKHRPPGPEIPTNLNIPSTTPMIPSATIPRGYYFPLDTGREV